MNAKDLYLRTQEDLSRGDNFGLYDNFKRYQIAHCYHPITINGFNPHTGKTELIQVPCGKCYHCRETKTNEWVTRMYCHLENFKNCYFVTLTYRNFETNFNFKYGRVVSDYLQDALYHRDDLNATHHDCYAPCVLCKKHYQNFLKRLRFNTGLGDLTYFMCGEYGKTYGRPHYHFIFFTNGTLTLQDIQKAWSLALFQGADGKIILRKNQKKNGICIDYSLGRVDFNDLVFNGTIDTKKQVRIDGKYMSAHSCFAYVSKYLCKDEYNDSRVRLAFNSMYEDINVLCHKTLENGKRFEFTKKKCSLRNDFKNLLVPHDYSILEDDFGHRSERFPNVAKDFVDLFRPFTSPSRATPIGSLYLKAHMSSFVDGVFGKSSLQDKGFVVPSYFRRKAEEYVFALRRQHFNQGVSSPYKGNLPLFYETLSQLYTGEVSHSLGVAAGEITTRLNTLLHSEYALLDLVTRTRTLISYDLGNKDCPIMANQFKYDRRQKSYVQVAAIPISDWLDDVLPKFALAAIRSDRSRSGTMENKEYFDKFKSSVDYVELHNRVMDDLTQFVESQQKLYHSKHKSIE